MFFQTKTSKTNPMSSFVSHKFVFCTEKTNFSPKLYYYPVAPINFLVIFYPLFKTICNKIERKTQGKVCFRLMSDVVCFVIKNLEKQFEWLHDSNIGIYLCVQVSRNFSNSH